MPTRAELVVHQKAYKDFLGQTESLRPDLYRYCRHLSASVWDAEDLVQETLLRCYGKLGWTYFEIRDWRAYLFRTASNLWLNEQRRNKQLKFVESPTTLEVPDEQPALSADVKEALLLLLDNLAPQERVALVLKEVFEVSTSDIATHLQTSTGAVKNALHRAREKLAGARTHTAAASPPLPSRPAVLDAFVAAFNDHNIDRIVALLREDATTDVVGLVQENNRDDIKNGSLPHTVCADSFSRLYHFRGEWLAVIGRRQQGTEEFSGVGTIIRFVTDGQRIVHMNSYYFTRELLQEVLGELGLPADICDVYFYS